MTIWSFFALGLIIIGCMVLFVKQSTVGDGSDSKNDNGVDNFATVRKYYSEGDYSSGLRAIEIAKASHYCTKSCNLLYGLLKLKTGSYLDSLQICQQVTKIDKCYPGALNCVGASYLLLKEINKSRAEYVSALKFCNATDIPTLIGYSSSFLELEGDTENLHSMVTEDIIRSKNNDYSVILEAISPQELTYLNRFSEIKNINGPERDMYVQLLVNYVRALLNSASVSPDCFSTEIGNGDTHVMNSTASGESFVNENINENMNENINENENKNVNRYNVKNRRSDRGNLADVVTDEMPFSALATASAAHCSRCIGKAIYILRLITTSLPAHSSSAQLLHFIFSGQAMHSESLKVAKRFMGSTPTYYLGHYLMGSSLLESNRQFEAISALDVAVMLNTDTKNKNENYEILMKTKFLIAMAYIDGNAYVSAVPLLREVVHIMETRTLSKEIDLFPRMFRGGRTELRVGRNFLERNTYCALGTALLNVRDSLGAYVALLKCVSSFENQISIDENENENDINNWTPGTGKTRVSKAQTNPSDIIMYADMYVHLSNVQRLLGFQEEAKSSIKRSEVLLEKFPELKNEKMSRDREKESERNKNKIESKNGNENESKNDYVNENKERTEYVIAVDGRKDVPGEMKENSLSLKMKNQVQDSMIVKNVEKVEKEVIIKSAAVLNDEKDSILLKEDSVNKKQQDDINELKNILSTSHSSDNKIEIETKGLNIIKEETTESIKDNRNSVSAHQESMEEIVAGGILGADSETNKMSGQTDNIEVLAPSLGITQEDSSTSTSTTIPSPKRDVEVEVEVVMEVEAEVKGDKRTVDSQSASDIKSAGYTVSPLDVPVLSSTTKRSSNDGGKKGGVEGQVERGSLEGYEALMDAVEGTGRGTGIGVGTGTVAIAGKDEEISTETSIDRPTPTPASVDSRTISSTTSTSASISNSTSASTSSTTSTDTTLLKKSLGTSTSTSTLGLAAEMVDLDSRIKKSEVPPVPEAAASSSIPQSGKQGVEVEAEVAVDAGVREYVNINEVIEDASHNGRGVRGTHAKTGGSDLEDASVPSGLSTSTSTSFSSSSSSSNSSSISSDLLPSSPTSSSSNSTSVSSDLLPSTSPSTSFSSSSSSSNSTSISTDILPSTSSSSSTSSSNSSSISSDLLPSSPTSSSSNSTSVSSDLLPSTSPSSTSFSFSSSSSSSNSTSISSDLLPSSPTSSSPNSTSVSSDLLPSTSPSTSFSSSSSSSNSTSISTDLLPSNPTSPFSSSSNSTSTSASASTGTPGDSALPPIPAVSSPKPVPTPPSPAQIRMASQYMMIASAYVGRGDYELALNQLAKAEKKAENYPEIYMMRASVYQALGQYDKAAGDYLKIALDLDPGNSTAIDTASALGKHLMQTGKYSDAVNVLRPLHDLNRTDSALGYALAVSLTSLQRYEEALTILALTDTSIDLNRNNNQSTLTVTANVKNIPKESSAENSNSYSNSRSNNSNSSSDSNSDGKNRTQDLTPGSVPLTPQRVKLLTALYERTGRGGKAEELYVRAVQEGLSSYSELAETYVRQGKYVEAVKSFEKEIYKITGDLDLDSIPNSTDSSSSKSVSEAKGENKTITIESVEEVAKVGKEVEKEVGENSTEVTSDEINAENKKQNSSLSNPITPTTSTANSTITSTSTSSNKRSYTEEFHEKKIKVLTTIEKNKLKLLHMRLGNIYGNYLLDLKLAAFHYEKTLEYGGDMNKEIRMFFAKNAHDLETLKKDEIKIKMGVNPGVEGTKKVNVSLSDHISNVLNNSSNKNQNQTKGSGQSSEKVQIPVPSGDGKQIKGPKAGPAVPSRRNRWVVRSDVIEDDGAQGGGPGVHAGSGDGAGAGAAGNMKMGGMGKINGGGGGGEEGAERGEVDARRQGAGGGGGQSGESSFESQIRRKEELQEAEEEERIRTGTSSSTSASTGTGTTASAVLSALSSNRRGR